MNWEPDLILIQKHTSTGTAMQAELPYETVGITWECQNINRSHSSDGRFWNADPYFYHGSLTTVDKKRYKCVMSRSRHFKLLCHDHGINDLRI